MGPGLCNCTQVLVGILQERWDKIGLPVIWVDLGTSGQGFWVVLVCCTAVPKTVSGYRVCCQCLCRRCRQCW